MSLTKTERRQDRRETPDPTGLPVQLKRDFEAKSGLSFDDVRVHYRSSRPGGLGALAYTQGNQVYLGPGQERHLPHELAHVVQQKQGRVGAEVRLGGVPLNLDPTLEAEADRFSAGMAFSAPEAAWTGASPGGDSDAPVQMRVTMDYIQFYKLVRKVEPPPPPTNERILEYYNYFQIENEMKFLNAFSSHGSKPVEKFKIIMDQELSRSEKTEESMKLFLEASHYFVETSNKLYAAEPFLTDFEYAPPMPLSFIFGPPAPGLPPPAVPDPSTLGPLRKRLHTLARSPENPIQQDKAALPLNKNSSKIPVLPFTLFMAQTEVPPELVNLVRDIYTNWRLGEIFDRRTGSEARSITPDTPGGLRSLHMNLQASLPSPINPCDRFPLVSAVHYMSSISEDIVLDTMAAEKSPAKGLHDHYKEFSKMNGRAEAEQTGTMAKSALSPASKAKAAPPSKAASQKPQTSASSAASNKPQAYPVGYAEYTGIAFGGKPDQCKIVLDYIHGFLYLTLTHYQYYYVDSKGEIVVKDKNYAPGTFNPWIKIDMTL